MPVEAPDLINDNKACQIEIRPVVEPINWRRTPIETTSGRVTFGIGVWSASCLKLVVMPSNGEAIWVAPCSSEIPHLSGRIAAFQ